MERNPKKYELAYLLSPAVGDDNVLELAHKLTKTVEESRGIIRHQENPRKRRLAYPVNKEREAYFGWLTFSADIGEASIIEKKLKTFSELLRHLLVEEEEIPVQPIRAFVPRTATSLKPRPITHGPEIAKPEEPLDLEELDKKLEEILGK